MNHIRNSYVGRILYGIDDVSPSDFDIQGIRQEEDCFGRLRIRGGQCVLFFDNSFKFRDLIHSPDKVGYPWEEDDE